jgi:predicted signal transduction protein with EAL and GGDEF domain
MSKVRSVRAIVVAALVILAVAAAAAGGTILRLRAIVIEEGIKDTTNTAIVVAEQIDRSIQSIDLVLTDLWDRIAALHIEDPGQLRHALERGTFHATMMDRLARLPQAFSLAVADQDGNIVASTSGHAAHGINIGDRDYFQNARANDLPLTVSAPYLARVSRETTMAFAKRLNAADGSFAGIVFSSVPVGYFKQIDRPLEAVEGHSFMVARKDGVIITRFPDLPRTYERIPLHSGWYHKVAEGGGSYHSHGFEGQTSQLVATQVSRQYPLVTTVGIAEAPLLKEWQRLSITIACGTLLIVGCAIFLLWFVLRQFRQLGTSETSLAEKSEMLDTALHNMSQGLTMFDQDLRLIMWNDQYQTVYNIPACALRPGMTLRDVINLRAAHGSHTLDAPDDHPQSRLEAGKDIVPVTVDRIDHLGNGRIVRVKRQVMANGWWVTTHEDVTDMQRNEARIAYLAHTDIITGLANRSHFMEKIEAARVQLAGHGEPFSIFMLDLDHFKFVNDSLGHAAGDLLLKAAGERLQTAIRDFDVVARFGGDEFAIIHAAARGAPSLPSPAKRVEDARERADAGGGLRRVGARDHRRDGSIVLANRILDAFKAPFEIEGHKMYVGTSIGIALAPDDGADSEDLLKKADLALYETKARGRNGFTFFDPRMTAAVAERHEIEADMRLGLARGEFELHYQPVVDVRTRSVSGVEALVRWRHPEHGLMPPARFIPLAESTGLIIPLGEWVLHQACRDAMAWPSHVTVAVNLSAVQFRKCNLLDAILGALSDSGLPPQRLEIEVTETVLLEKDTDHIALLHRLKEIGVSVALDDFGTGYSSLSYLTMFPFDKIKIDQSFIKEMAERADCAAIVCSVIGLGRSLDMITTAEGIETEEQFEIIRAAGVTLAQGYLFGKPCPAAELDLGSDLAITRRRRSGGGSEAA